MDMKGYQNYKQQSVTTMTQGELLLLLYDELVKRITRAELALQKEDFPLFEASIDRCVDIVGYLDDTLDRQYPISNELARLYEFFSYDLKRIKVGRNKGELERVKPMLIDLRDSFRTADRNAAGELQGKSNEG